MTKPVRFEGEATAELDAAMQWYEERRAGVGARLLRDTDELVARIGEFPSAGSPVPGVPRELHVRRALMRRYPYYLAYLELDDHVRVVAFGHMKRRPGYWHERLSKQRG